MAIGCRRDYTCYERCDGDANAKSFSLTIRFARDESNPVSERNACAQAITGHEGFAGDEARTNAGESEHALASKR